MLLYRLTFWTSPPLAETWLPMLGQAETIVEKGYNAVMQGGTQFGHSDDGVKFGITLFALLAVVGALAYLYIASERSNLKEAKKRIGELELEIKNNRESYERKYDDQRAAYDKRTDGHFGIVQVAVAEIGAMNKVMQGMGIHIQRPTLQMPPPVPVTETPQQSGRASFLPSAQPMRRIPPSPHGGPREGRIKLGGQDEN